MESKNANEGARKLLKILDVIVKNTITTTTTDTEGFIEFADIIGTKRYKVAECEYEVKKHDGTFEKKKVDENDITEASSLPYHVKGVIENLFEKITDETKKAEVLAKIRKIASAMPDPETSLVASAN